MKRVRPIRGEGASPTSVARAKARGRGAHATIIAPLLAVMMVLFQTGLGRATAPATNEVHFRAVDILIDPHGEPLAAYQLEFTGESENVKLVGIEGGAHPAFKDPPYYDPAAMMHSRVILAALNAGDDLPSLRTRVARLHLEITGDHPSFRARLIVAAKPDGSKLAADVSVEEGEKP